MEFVIRNWRIDRFRLGGMGVPPMFFFLGNHGHRTPINRLLSLLFAIVVVAPLVRASTVDESSLQFFESKIRPILSDKCYSCHSGSAKKLKAELYLDSREGMLKGGESGAAVAPGHPEQSRLMEAVEYKNVDLQMPPKDKLSDAQIADLTTWVKMGAPWPKETAATSGTAKGGFDLQQRKASHWAWQPIKATVPPAVKNEAWARDGIDRFILAGLEGKGLSPAPDVDRRSLIRRAYFDLIGLPPSPAEVDAFLADKGGDAFSKVVDHLLASSQFGERWARHWMDVARYAESYGHEFDFLIAYSWQYRDYLIRALNSDVPYDQFVTEQIAGDLLTAPRLNPTEHFNESIIGTGFWWFCEQVHSPVEVMQHQADRIDNQVDTMGKAFLGLTFGCARCHDHKFDAISTKDVYGLWGFVESSRRQDALLDPNGRIHAAVMELTKARAQGNGVFASGLRSTSVASGETISRYLLATRAMTEQHASAEVIAQQSGLDAGRLKRWIAALSDEALRNPSHPMYAWSNLNGGPESTFAARREKGLEKLTEMKRAAAKELAETVVFKDFSDGNYDGWYVTGEAFGELPSRRGDWDSAGARSPSIVERGAAHSGLLGGRLKGVLRSPDFTIRHDTLLYRTAGHDGQIRLIVDGFTMDVFNKLLFAGHEFKVNQDQFGWIAQTQDVGRYIGHRAHIELIDDGDGWLAVEQIRFANGKGKLLESPNGIGASALADSRITSAETLAMAFGVSWNEAVDSFKNKTLTGDQAQWMNWLFGHQLVELNDGLANISLAAIGQTMAAVDRTVPEPMRVVAMADGDGVDDHVYIRGSYKNAGEIAPRRFIEAIAGADQPPVGKRSGRLELAKRMTASSNPLLPRVMVNRLWHHLFGRGIVASTDNFGVLGSPPTHPELLDFLSTRFVQEGWSVKRAIRAMMLSRTYQMASSATDAKAEEADPQNLLLHRANARRLEGEAIRDEILSVSGRLDRTLYGAPVDVHLTAFMNGRGKPGVDGPLDGAGRRSIYTIVRRNFLPPMMLAFDTPIPFSAMGRRSVSNVPAQALILMNDPFVIQQAELWARRVLAEKELSPEQRIARMYVTAFARPPREAEMMAGLKFLEQQGESLGLPADQRKSDARVWTDYAHVMMNLKEFVFLN